MPDIINEETLPEVTLLEGEEGDVKLFGGEILEEEVPEKKESVEEKEEVETKEEVKEEVKEEEEEVEGGELPPLEGRTRPTFKDIKAKYPNFFKDFPDARHVFFREHEFTELLGDIEEAKETVEQAKDFQYFEEQVTKGDAKSLLETIRDGDKGNLKQFAHNILPALREVDNETFLEVTAPFLQSIISSAYKDGNNAGNENLKNSALHLAQYIFGNMDFATGKSRVPEYKPEAKPVDKEREEFESEKKRFTQERYQAFDKDVKQEGFYQLKKIVLDSLDLDEGVTDFTKRHLIEDIFDEIDNGLVRDSDHMRKMKLLWQQAERNNFDLYSKSRIVSAYLKRAKELLPDASKKIKSLALKSGMSSRSNGETRREITGGTRSSGGNKNRRPTDARQVDWKATSDEDLFSGNVKYKS